MRMTCLGLLLCAGCAAQGPSLEPDRPPALKRTGVPVDFTMTHFPSGKPWRLSGEHGSVVLLDVWATWCDPCREALPVYDALRVRYAEKGLVVYAVSVDATTQPIPQFLLETKVGLPVLHDPSGTVAESTLRVKMMPTSLLIDRQGVIRHVHEGFDEELTTTLGPEIDALLAEPPLTPPAE